MRGERVGGLRVRSAGVPRVVGVGHAEDPRVVGAGYAEDPRVVGAGYAEDPRVVGAGYAEDPRVVGAGHAEDPRVVEKEVLREVRAGHVVRQTVESADGSGVWLAWVAVGPRGERVDYDVDSCWKCWPC